MDITKVITRRKEINELMERRELLKEKIRSPASAQIRTASVNHSINNRLERLYTELDDVENKLFKALGELITAQDELARRIEDLKEESHKEVLFDRYIKCMKFTQIAEKRQTDVRHVYRVHQAALTAWEALKR